MRMTNPVSLIIQDDHHQMMTFESNLVPDQIQSEVQYRVSCRRRA